MFICGFFFVCFMLFMVQAFIGLTAPPRTSRAGPNHVRRTCLKTTGEAGCPVSLMISGHAKLLSAMHTLIEKHREQIARICEHHGVRRLEVFGSAARADDFDTTRSDADFIVEFDTSIDRPTLDDYFSLREALEQILGRPVDLVMAGSVNNPYLQQTIDQSREAIYAA